MKTRKEELRQRIEELAVERFRILDKGEQNVLKALHELMGPEPPEPKKKPSPKRFPVAPQPKPRKIEL